MKKIKINKILPIVAVFAAVGAAIVPAHKSGAQSSGTSYYWFTPSNAYTGSQNTEAAQVAATGCDGDDDECQRGYLGTQFNVTNNPNSGLKANQEPQTTIYRHQ